VEAERVDLVERAFKLQSLRIPSAIDNRRSASINATVQTLCCQLLGGV
jgi:hypothetical protein